MSNQDDFSTAVRRAIEANRKIEAIKLLREERGIGLKEAKTIIDREMAEYRQANPESARATSNRGLTFVISFVVLAAILYFIFNKFT